MESEDDDVMISRVCIVGQGEYCTLLCPRVRYSGIDGDDLRYLVLCPDCAVVFKLGDTLFCLHPEGGNWMAVHVGGCEALQDLGNGGFTAFRCEACPCYSLSEEEMALFEEMCKQNSDEDGAGSEE
jgi:hypothetical protein